MNGNVETGMYEILKNKFTEGQSKELIGHFKSLTNDDLLNRVDDKVSTAKSEIIATLTWRLLFFFIAQVGFTLTLIKLMG